MSCNVDSHETVMSPASCAALYNYNVLSSCADVCMKKGGCSLNDGEIKHEGDGNVDICYVHQ